MRLGRGRGASATSAGTPLEGVDLLMADLDGVVYTGADAVPHAVESLNASGLPIAYITNNASRTDEQVAEHLASFGLSVAPADVVTSPQAAMRLLRPHLQPGDRVLVVGGDGLTSQVEAAGWQVVRTAAEDPAAVVQGFHPTVAWTDLAEAAFALHRGIPWIATNTDWTIPQAGGIAPGNGTLVSAVHTAVGRMAEVAGKPEAPIFELARERFASTSPLMIGDRLDTDIKGGRAAGIATLLTLTGVDGPKQVIAATPDMRPTFIVSDLRGMFEPYPETRETLERSTGDVYFEVGEAAVRRSGIDVTLVRAGSTIDTLRAGCAAVWSSGTSIHSLRVAPEVYPS